MRRLADLCCGIGGDAIALARAGIEVLAVDRDPLTCDVVRANAAALGLADLIEVRCQDVGDADVSGYDAVFVDPARRGGKGRIFDPEAYSPPLSWAVEVARRVSHAALKVAPGIPHEAVPEDAEAEWISDGGRREGGGALVRCRGREFAGEFTRTSDAAARAPTRSPSRRAARPARRSGRAATCTSPTAPSSARTWSPRWRTELDGRLIDPTIAYVTARRARTSRRTRPATRSPTCCPSTSSGCGRCCASAGIGVATVKKRGSAVEPEELRKKLKLDGPNSCTVFLTRVAGAPTVLLGHPLRP